MPDIGAVIFDVYETLAHNHSSLWLPAFDEICQEQGLPLTGQGLWDLWKPLEMRFRQERRQPDGSGNLPPFKTYEQAWKECFEQVFHEIGKGAAAAAARRCVVVLGQRELFPEAVEVVTLLKSADRFRMGVMSNADNDSLWPLLRRHGLEFDGVVSSEAARAYKPHPQAFRLIIEALGVPAEACLFVGDQQFDDVKGAKDIGIQAVWVNRQGAQPDPDLVTPDYQVADLTELLDILGVSRRDSPLG